MRTKAGMLQKAGEIRAQAGTVADPYIRRQLLEIAAQYETMADYHERAASVIVVTPSSLQVPLRR
jgi:hypothetical protein